jgi:hypothetical protein
MKTHTLPALAFYFVAAGMCLAQFHTNTITTPNDMYAYRVDGGSVDNPTILLEAGVTNILDIQAYPDHPVIILTDAFEIYGGANPQGVYDQPMGLVTPSTGFPTKLIYMCEVHGFSGEIHFSLPSPFPPPNTILQIRVGTNVVMTSTGTNTTWTLVPEFSSNLVSGLWAPVSSYTNTFANGTNTTVFDRLDPICGPSVFLRLRQTQN